MPTMARRTLDGRVTDDLVSEMPAAALIAMCALSLKHPIATPRGSFIAGAVGMRTFLK
jgi:hypothetical protein